MASDGRDLLTVLKAELEFVRRGGYLPTARSFWRPHFIFQDSPTCLNFEDTQIPQPCSNCVMMELTPAPLRGAKIPCRHIPLNEQGETIDSLYRTATLEEIEAVLTKWLEFTIQRLEAARAQDQHANGDTRIGQPVAANRL